MFYIKLEDFTQNHLVQSISTFPNFTDEDRICDQSKLKQLVKSWPIIWVLRPGCFP